MRNLKRALSLALASVMLMGMMAVGTGAADFADSSDIQNTEAATVLSALEIMVGDGENFNPDAIVTRAEMAMLLCKMMQVDENLLESNKYTVVFDDVAAGMWYTGAIAHAAEMGWIVGDGAGNFNPNNTVTTAQAALMIQKALGYWSTYDPATVDADGNLLDVTGSANTKAYGLNMMNDLTLAAGAGLTRDNVAGMLYNTILNNVFVIYDTTVGYVLADYTDKLATTTNVAKYALGDGADIAAGSIFLNFGLEEADEEYTDALGRPVTAWELDGELVTYTEQVADFIYTEATDAEDIADDMDVDYDDNDTFFDGIATSLETENTVVEIFGEDETATVVTYTYLAGIVTDVDEDEDDDVITTTVTVDGEDFVTTATVDFAEDDVVVYVMADTTLQKLDPTTGVAYTGDIAIMEIADTVAGSVTATATSYIRLDGVKYEVTNTGDAVIGGEGIVVLDPNGYAISYIADEEDDSIGDYAYITAIRTASDAATGNEVGYADLVLVDGSAVTVALDMDDDDTTDITDAITELAPFTAAVYGYSISSGLYALDAIADATDAENDVMTATASTGITIANSTRTIITSTLTAGFDTIFVDVTNGVAYTGIEDVPTYDDEQELVIYYVADDTKVAEVIFITTGTLDGVSADATYVYVADTDCETSINSDDVNIYTYTEIYIDGVQVDIESTKADLLEAGTGLFVISTEDTDGYVTALGATATVDAGVVEDVTSKAIYVGSDGYYTYDSATVFVVIDTDDTVSAGSASDIIINADVDSGDDTCTIEVLNDSTYAEIVIITIAVKS